VQDFITHQEEYGIFYVRLPGEKNGRITGIVQREFHTAQGDGKHTLEELIHADPRARYWYPSFATIFHSRRQEIIPLGEEVLLMEIGNHNKGVTFRDASNQITDKLEQEIDQLSKHIDGFYYGRYDIKADSIQSIIDKNYAVIELNMTYSEPTWVYDPRYNFLKMTTILLEHRRYIYQIATYNHKERRMPYATYRELSSARRRHDNHM
jgi:hypothetical protein